MGINFKGIDAAGVAGYSLTDHILYSLKFWIDHNLVANGGFDIYRVGQDSFLANDEASLKYAPDERYPDRTVFESVGRGFIWEQGGTIPSEVFRISGVYLNEIFVPVTDTGPNRFHVDNINGRVIFDESVAVDDIISANYCSRAIYTGFSDSKEFQLLMLDSIDEFLRGETPLSTPSKEHQVWLPAIFLSLDSGTGRGLQLGGGQIKERIITLYIFANDNGYRNLLMDFLDFQNRAAFNIINLNETTLPFDQYGDIIPGTTNFIDLMTANPYRKMRITEGTCKVLNSLNSNLFRAKVVWKCEIDMGGI